MAARNETEATFDPRSGLARRLERLRCRLPELEAVALGIGCPPEATDAVELLGALKHG